MQLICTRPIRTSIEVIYGKKRQKNCSEEKAGQEKEERVRVLLKQLPQHYRLLTVAFKLALPVHVELLSAPVRALEQREIA